ncbi:MAG TPA: hypothetical protein ENI23_17690 [bacterium]|nr:hypothetical protein [bacterium]
MDISSLYDLSGLPKFSSSGEGNLTHLDLKFLACEVISLFKERGYKGTVQVDFNRHFLERANHPRNGTPVTRIELQNLFQKVFITYSESIICLGCDAQIVLFDSATLINVPFVIRLNREENWIEFILKTVLRKRDFKTSDRVFTV